VVPPARRRGRALSTTPQRSLQTQLIRISSWHAASEPAAGSVRRGISDRPLGTKAAERAGYSAKSAKSLGSRLLSRPAVAAAIHEARIRRSSLVEVRQEEVLRELQLIAYRATERTGDRVWALELLGRHLGMFTDRLGMTTTKVRLEDLVPRPKPRQLPASEPGTAEAPALAPIRPPSRAQRRSKESFLSSRLHKYCDVS